MRILVKYIYEKFWMEARKEIVSAHLNQRYSFDSDKENRVKNFFLYVCKTLMPLFLKLCFKSMIGFASSELLEVLSYLPPATN